MNWEWFVLATTVAWLTVNSADTRIKHILCGWPVKSVQVPQVKSVQLEGLDKYLKDWLNLL